jgi:hypothetical protein
MSILKQRILLVSDMHYTSDSDYYKLAKTDPEAKVQGGGYCSTLGITQQKQNNPKLYNR